jgi:hypothetical protein
MRRAFLNNLPAHLIATPCQYDPDTLFIHNRNRNDLPEGIIHFTPDNCIDDYTPLLAPYIPTAPAASDSVSSRFRNARKL